MEEINVKEQLEKIGKDLNILFEESDMQDWGLIYADDKRVEELMDYFISNPLNKTMQFYVLELIVYSYNETLLLNNAPYHLQNKLANVLNQADQRLNFLLTNWRTIADDDFPVGRLI